MQDLHGTLQPAEQPGAQLGEEAAVPDDATAGPGLRARSSDEISEETADMSALSGRSLRVPFCHAEPSTS